MVDEFQPPLRVDPREERELRVGRAALDQRAARIVAHAPGHRGADAARADDGMRLAADRAKAPLEVLQGGAGQADDLVPVPDQVDAGHAQRADDHDRPVVAVAERRRSPGQSRIGRLQDDGDVVIDARLQHPPLLEERARLHGRGDLALAVAVAGTEPPRSAPADMDVTGADDLGEPRDEDLGHSSCSRCRGARPARTRPHARVLTAPDRAPPALLPIDLATRRIAPRADVTTPSRSDEGRRSPSGRIHACSRVRSALDFGPPCRCTALT